MRLREIDVPVGITTSNMDNPYDVINPLLKCAKYYDRGVAYFHSEWIALAYEGLTEFIKNGGQIRLLTSISVDRDEFEAFKRGEEAKTNEVLKRELIQKNIESCNSNNSLWTLYYLSWMISEGIMDVRISCVPNDKFAIYHDKVLFISDNDDTICIHGSLNDSLNSLKNHESVNVFVSWEKRDNERIKFHRKYFEIEWIGKTNSDYVVIKLPDMLKIEFSQLKRGFNPFTYEPELKIENMPRDYQIEAVKALQDSDWHGIFAMATGTGKTLTSIFALKKFNRIHGPICVCIVAPQLHLIKQWGEVIKSEFRTTKIIECTQSRTLWLSPLIRKTKEKVKENLFVLTTYKTLIDDSFQYHMSNFKDGVFYIFDECHKLGSNSIVEKLCLNKINYCIGLSATPERWMDERGTKFLSSVIGPQVYEFSLAQAIKQNMLTPYKYECYLSELSDDENFEFQRYSVQINQTIMNINSLKEKNKSTKSLEERLRTLLNNRARISKKCSSKKASFLQLFEKLGKPKFTIVYVFDEQVEDMVETIKRKFALNVRGIIAKTPINERIDVLNAFNCGDIDVLVAIQCLDEGIDIPNCRNEFILASSTNPREFIQRRGRVLRLAKNKDYGYIYDFVTIAPNDFMTDLSDKINVISRELSRIAEFVRVSDNKDDNVIVQYLSSLGALELYTQHSPWEISERVQYEEEEILE